MSASRSSPAPAATLEPVAGVAGAASPSPTPADCVARAIGKLAEVQQANGSFEGEVVWCPMILAQYVILRGLIKKPVEAAERDGMIRHFRVTQRGDGGWGLHPESGSYVYVTTLAYVALRLLGEAPDGALAAPARRWLHAQPSGVLGIPSWGKFWLALIGLYDYRGVNPCPPELFMLPAWSPVRADHLYCHTRYIYLAICHLYGARYCGDLGLIVAALRRELYPVPYEQIDFSAHRHHIAATDLYVAPSGALRAAWNAMAAYERLQDMLPPLKGLRARALKRTLERIRFEQQASNFQGLSPVNGMLNTIALAANDPRDPMIAPSLAGVESWRWQDAEGGTRFAGARSTSWDTGFALLAAVAGPGHALHDGLLRRAYAFLTAAQETEELAGGAGEARDCIRGGWCFSDGHHRWPVSDCTAEALSALLAADAIGLAGAAERLSDERIAWAAGFILDRQNADGGFGTYERRRGGRLLERLNPSEMFGNCMTELSYIECTGSAVMALCRLREQHPKILTARVERAIASGCAFLRRRQRADGSYPGFWGINFTYATWFAVAALRAAGVPAGDPALQRAAAWLVARQKPDGGWGEHHAGCLNDTYTEHPESQPTMTSWAVLALIDVLGAGAEPVRRGIAWLCRAQQPDGTWPTGAVNGVFFGAAMLTYRLYPLYFPTWALNRYLAVAGHAAGN